MNLSANTQRQLVEELTTLLSIMHPGEKSRYPTVIRRCEGLLNRARVEMSQPHKPYRAGE